MAVSCLVLFVKSHRCILFRTSVARYIRWINQLCNLIRCNLLYVLYKILNWKYIKGNVSLRKSGWNKRMKQKHNGDWKVNALRKKCYCSNFVGKCIEGNVSTWKSAWNERMKQKDEGSGRSMHLERNVIVQILIIIWMGLGIRKRTCCHQLVKYCFLCFKWDVIINFLRNPYYSISTL